MPLRNGPDGYGLVTKTLHWITFLALAAQFTVGYAMDDDGEGRGRECDPAGESRSGGDTTDAEEDRLDRIEERCERQQDLRRTRRRSRWTRRSPTSAPARSSTAGSACRTCTSCSGCW